MKVHPNTLNLAEARNCCPDLVRNLQQARSRLLSLQRQDGDNSTLYQLLCQQNQLFQEQLASLEAHWKRHCPDSSPSKQWLQAEVQSLAQLVQTHCQLVAWLSRGNDDSDGGPVNNLPLPKSPQPQPPHQNSSASPGQALDFN